MISQLSRGDFEDLRARGLSPTLEDFDRLNSIALRLTDGAETTAASFPRIGWAGDIPFHQPTFQVFEWYLAYVQRIADIPTRDAAWFFALSRARDRNAFDGLRTAGEITEAVDSWLSSLPVTLDEVRRACRYAASGFDDAEPAKPEAEAAKTDGERAADNLDALHRRMTEAAAVTGIPPGELEAETPSRINELTKNAVRLARGGDIGGPDKSRLMRDYDLTFREIAKRLTAEKEAAENG